MYENIHRKYNGLMIIWLGRLIEWNTTSFSLFDRFYSFHPQSSARKFWHWGKVWIFLTELCRISSFNAFLVLADSKSIMGYHLASFYLFHCLIMEHWWNRNGNHTDYLNSRNLKWAGKNPCSSWWVQRQLSFVVEEPVEWTPGLHVRLCHWLALFL